MIILQHHTITQFLSWRLFCYSYICSTTLRSEVLQTPDFPLTMNCTKGACRVRNKHNPERQPITAEALLNSLRWHHFPFTKNFNSKRYFYVEGLVYFSPSPYLWNITQWPVLLESEYQVVRSSPPRNEKFSWTTWTSALVMTVWTSNLKFRFARTVYPPPPAMELLMDKLDSRLGLQLHIWQGWLSPFPTHPITKCRDLDFGWLAEATLHVYALEQHPVRPSHSRIADNPCICNGAV